MANNRNSSNGHMSAPQIVRRAIEQVAVLTGRQIEGVNGLERNGDDGWVVTLEVVELRRATDSRSGSMRAELSPAEVDELIQESLGEARAAVKERLRAKFERELEAQVEARRGAQGAGRRGQGAGGGAQGADIGARGAGRHEAEA